MPDNTKDPICGNCGNPLSTHHREAHRSDIFCNLTTTGDIYTTEPQEDMITARMVELYPQIYDRIVDEWKRKNGHG